MAQSMDTADSSDDLIAELARLMAEDAQGETAEATRPAADAHVRPSERMNKLHGENVVRIPGQGGAMRQLTPVTDRSPEAEIEAPNSGRSAGAFENAFSAKSSASAPRAGVDVPAASQRDEGDTLTALVGRADAADASETNASEEMDVAAEEDGFDPIAALIEQNEAQLRDAQDAMQREERSAAIRAEALREAEARVAAQRQADAERRELTRLEAQLNMGHSAESEAPEPKAQEPQASQAPVAARNGASPARQDHFNTPPVFGLGSAPEARKPATPLDEIESLIGDAVRVGVQARQVQAGAVEAAPSARSAQQDPGIRDAADAAEAAIVAATQASGETPARYVETDAHDERADTVRLDRDHDEMPVRRRGRVMVPVAAGLVLVAAAAGLYWVYGVNGGDVGSVPFLVSNTTDAKVAANVTSESGDSANSAVFSQLEGSSGEDAPAEQLVSRDQAANGLDTPEIRQVETDDPALGLANRKVRTVTVRPDGTIVTGDDAVAANEVLPIDRPNVPELPASEGGDAGTFSVASVGNALVDTAAAGVSEADSAQATMESLIAAANQTSDGDVAAVSSEAVTPGAETVTTDFPLPLPRPAARIANAAPQTPTLPTQQAVTRPPSNSEAVDLIAGSANDALTTQSISAPTVLVEPVALVQSSGAVDNGGPYVQLASLRSAEQANASLETITRRYQNVFQGQQAMVKEIDLADRGIYYRVLLPAASLLSANEVCTNIKAAGGDCFVRSN